MREQCTPSKLQIYNNFKKLKKFNQQSGGKTQTYDKLDYDKLKKMDLLYRPPKFKKGRSLTFKRNKN